VTGLSLECFEGHAGFAEPGEAGVTQLVTRRMLDAGTAAGAGPVDQALEEAEAALEAGETGAASALFGQVLQHEAQNVRALAGTLRCLLASGDHAGARRTFDGLPEDLRKDPVFAPVATALELAEAGAGAGEIPDLEAQVAQNGDDHQARFDLAMALYAADKSEAAADELLEIIRRDRSWNDEGARKQLVKFFEAWGATNPLTLQARRRLSSLLFS